jgi:4-hydroxy-tetrahydrodipicolinate synthase
MVQEIPDGVWPTMLTPFTESDEVDYDALDAMVEWYITQGVDGLFAVCLSSEMYNLTLYERVQIARFVKERTGNRIPVVASGHISEGIADQIAELKAMATTGVDAIVWSSNHLAVQNENDDVWKNNAKKLMEAIPDIPLGIYECPVPYKRLMSPQLLKWCADTGRFLFLKDTCCDLEQIKAKSEAVQGSNLKVYNANSTTLLESLKMGIAGFSGVMANFHPFLYVWLTRNWAKKPDKAAKLQNFLGLASLIESQNYPMNGKYHMQLYGLPIKLHTRNRKLKNFTYSHRLQVEQLYELAKEIKEKLTN